MSFGIGSGQRLLLNLGGLSRLARNLNSSTESVVSATMDSRAHP